MNKPNTDLPQPRPDQQYMNIDVDAETMAAVKTLAAEANVTPFEMCVILMQESMASRVNASQKHP